MYGLPVKSFLKAKSGLHFKPLISGSIATLNNLKTSPGEHFLSLDKFLEEKLMDFGIVLPNTSFDFKTAIK